MIAEIRFNLIVIPLADEGVSIVLLSDAAQPSPANAFFGTPNWTAGIS
jgi:hypothetical protein